jgi:hypothetical protein
MIFAITQLPGHIIKIKNAIWSKLPFLSIRYHAAGDMILIILYQSSGKIGRRLNTANHILIMTNILQNCTTISSDAINEYAVSTQVNLPNIIIIIHQSVARMILVRGPTIATRKSHFTGLR